MSYAKARTIKKNMPYFNAAKRPTELLKQASPVNSFDQRDEIYEQMERIITLVSLSKNKICVSFSPYELYYDFHPALLAALDNDRDKYIKCMTVYYYVAMRDIDAKDVPYYLNRFGISMTEYNAMLEQASYTEFVSR